MIIAGYKQATLIDFPGKLSTVVFIYGCNLRCRFCHNPELVVGPSPLDRTEDFFADLEKHGIKSVAITGGEPLLADDFINFLNTLKEMNLSVKLDTNGSLPLRLKRVLNENLVDYVAMDMKGFSDEDLLYITRKPFKFSVFEESLNILKDSGTPHEIRLTLWKKLTDKDVKVLDRIGEKTQSIFIQKLVKSGRILDKRFSPLSDEEFEEEKLKIQDRIRGIRFRDYSTST